MSPKDFFYKINLNVRLAGIAGLLGLIAFIIGNPNSETEAKINTKELALIVENNSDQISVETIADWIIKGKADYRLIDLRTEKEFSDYTIPTSENIQITNLLGGDLLKNEKIILFANDDSHSTQAWFLLKAKDFQKVYRLDGGMDEWKNKILFPKLPAEYTTEQKAEFDKLAEVSKYFGGSPQTGIEQTAVTAAPALPKLSAPAGAVGGGAKKKKREGC